MGNKKTKDKTVTNAALAGIASDVVDRFGSAVKEHEVAYSGVDNEAGQTLQKGLKTISGYNRGDPSNPDYDRITKAQTGFSAEVKEVARRRAEEAIAGGKPRTMRTDDVSGHVNDQLYDITSEVDSNGNPVPHSSAQMKFVGSSPDAAAEKLLSKDFNKYIENDVKMVVPSDYYDGIKANLGERIASLKKQIQYLQENGGNPDALKAKQAELQKCETLNKNLVKSNVSNAEAIEARNNPLLSTAKDIVRVAHRAGVEQAKMGAAIGGGMSLVRNLIAVYKGEKSKEDAALAVVGDTAGAATLSYATAFGGAVIKGSMQNSSSSMLRSVSKTNLPAYIATTAWETGKTLKAYFSGDIDGVQCLEQLGEKGYGMTASALFAGIGQVAIPIPVVGALAGSMIGYALSSVSYNILKTSLAEAKIARAERIRIEKECNEAIAMLRQYRQELEDAIQKYFQEQNVFFEQTFCEIKKAFNTGDIDGYIAGTNKITEHFGKEPLYSNMEEFEQIMGGDEPLKI